MNVDDLPFSGAADRNKGPILQVLQRLLPATARVLEIASGTGQHARHFAQVQPGWSWQPTDTTDDARLAIDARCAGLTNVRPALRLDVLETAWPAGPYDAIYCANMLHISPWATCPALMHGAAAHLAPGGLLLLYGPYRVDGVPTAPSNEAFDADLKARNASWGLRALADVEREAAAVGLALQEVVTMPANNLIVVFAKRA
jgi:SAM-dependent methyltransferase